MKIIKRRMFAIAVMVGVLFTTGCGNTETATNENDVYSIGICQLVEHTALNEATQGFQDALTEKLGDKVTFDVKVCDGTKDNCTEVTTQFVKDGVDLIMANATTALQAANQATNSIPIVATSITDYGTALNIRNWNGVSGINVTGTSDLAPIEEQENLFKELLPDVQKVGILYCETEANSVYQVQKMMQALSADGIEYEEFAVSQEEDVEEAARQAADSCDAIYIPTDNLMAASVDLLQTVFMEEKVPAITGEEGVCAAGIATISIDYYSIGYTAGEMAYEILAEGSKPGEMSIQYAETFTKKYNADNCQAMGIEVNDEYEAIQ
jgi:putative ABC transport system substrate-binding protein